MANNIGSPTEAAKAMHKGVDTGAVKIISPTDKNSRLMKLVDQGAADDKRDMAKIEKELVARKNGDIDIKLGMSLLMAGETDRAIESFNRGLSAERIAQVKKPDDAYMLLGLAQYRKGDKAAAIAAFTQAKASTDMAKVADLWLNRLAAN
jgi:tetratricopeptide (TPR) repeat protein